jgi:hypothetical protein
MQPNGREKLSESPALGEMQPVALTGRRPTLERIRVEAEAASARRKRRITITRIASAVVVIALAAIAYALLAP